jgi:sirohydrochlorin ferrochelatase
MVHGSPNAEANADMHRVADVVRGRKAFDMVEVGFMECNEPTISEAIDSCAARGATSIVAVPYFLHTGTHVASDLPAILDEARSRHEDIEFSMGRYIGASQNLSQILADRANSACQT